MKEKKMVLTAAQRKKAADFYPVIKKIASRIATSLGLRGQDVEDMQREACFGLFEALTRFDESKQVKFETYVFFWCRKYIVRAYREGFAVTSDDISYEEHDMCHEEDDISVRENRLLQVDKMLALLNKRERQVVCMLYGINRKQMDFRQTAQHLGIKPATVHRIYNVAMSKMEFSNINNYENN